MRRRPRRWFTNLFFHDWSAEPPVDQVIDLLKDIRILLLLILIFGVIT
ncbi:hypothetical protein [Ancylobacter rudongensis]|uniref:Uncharacterized protein n=1 Tax=Ancylobacter rudongensis TaxID=177413 RepID=A0A1G4UQI5_9HYPH|nr:hypothetical protein [Ancylobacter rudongensis]SCW95892.1 hypothetical protein SAMN05660859_0141 [Ancylobacter rudongensis]